MSTLARTLSAYTGQQLIRVELLDGFAAWRPLIDLEHATLCRQFGLDPHRVTFELPDSAKGVGSARTGAGGSSRNGRKIDGYVMDRETKTPIGTITFAFQGERFRDHDPTNRDDRLRLG